MSDPDSNPEPCTADDVDYDPICEEIRRIRHEIAAEYDFDIGRHFADMRREQFLCGNGVVTRCKKTGKFIVLQKGTGTIEFEDDKEVPIARPFALSSRRS